VTPPFTAAQREAIRQLAELWASRPFVLVGASAIECQRPMQRATEDLDLTVAASLSELPAGLDQLPGWARNRAREHEWTGPGGVRLDIIPAGPELLAQGWVEWPTGHRMNLTGLEHAFVHTTPVAVAEGVSVKVATLPVIALLKMVSYLDRPAERRHDLHDLGFLIEEHAAIDDERRWSDEIVAAQLTFEVAGAFILGQEIGKFAGDPDRALIADFATWVRGNRHSTLSELARLAPPSWRNDEDEALERIEALVAGASMDLPFPHERRGV
jgi:predicted nucleotidyltransferase